MWRQVDKKRQYKTLGSRHDEDEALDTARRWVLVLVCLMTGRRPIPARQTSFRPSTNLHNPTFTIHPSQSFVQGLTIIRYRTQHLSAFVHSCRLTIDQDDSLIMINPTFLNISTAACSEPSITITFTQNIVSIIIFLTMTESYAIAPTKTLYLMLWYNF